MAQQIIPAYKYEIYDADDRLLNINYSTELKYEKSYQQGRYEKVTPVAFQLSEGATVQGKHILYNNVEMSLNDALNEYVITVATGLATVPTEQLPVQSLSMDDAVIITPTNEKFEIVRISDANQLVSMASFARTIHLTIVENYPDHEPREDSPYKKYFDATRRKMKKEGRLKCYICGADDEDENTTVELHHWIVEESLANGVDLEKFTKAYPDAPVTDEETFMQWVEQENNLLPLCVYHHRGAGGIHSILYPQWIAQRFWQKEIEVPAKYVKIQGFGEVVYVKN